MYMYLRVILEDASSEEVEEVGGGDDGLSSWYLHPSTQDQHVAESEERTGTILVLAEREERGGRKGGERRKGSRRGEEGEQERGRREREEGKEGERGGEGEEGRGRNEV